MYRSGAASIAGVVMVLGLMACATDEVDDRPLTLDYVTQAILVPSCANAQCHSSFRRAAGYRFDDVDAARATINGDALVFPGDPEASLLYLTLISPGGDGQVARMPYDQPIPDLDVELIRRWIAAGAVGL